ncbi:hypothetical protein SAMN02745166_03471 [Prosthecobacter debontii]|uniref:DUF5666 domain-containing protein n=1 Tax=Prosthecobacter debontii TaxID=48467 RepID=A0A1T4YJ63_9BACT|nr:hypothetical protein [Prosthecobacter debontii]SKB01822.1 hypothetical protein SAMN02745166_03471 [Prosthecobacter debontii]
MNARIKILIAAVSTLFLGPSVANAKRPSGTPMNGVVQSVDHSTRQIVFLQDDGSQHRFSYPRWATMTYRNTEVSPAAIKAGMRLRLNLRHPLFGDEFATRILCISEDRQPQNP